jgi:hypothetical protein
MRVRTSPGPPEFPAAGRIRLALDHVPAGLAPTSRARFAVVDVTPTGMNLIASDYCPGSGAQLGAMASDDDGPLHLVCIADEFDECPAPGPDNDLAPYLSCGSYYAREGVAPSGGGAIEWRPPVRLTHGPASALRVLGFAVPSAGPAMLSYRWLFGMGYPRTGPIRRIALESGAEAIRIDEPQPDADRDWTRAWPADLALSIDVSVANVRRKDQVLASWQLPGDYPNYPEKGFASCDASGCVGVFTYDKHEGNGVYVLRARRGG